MANAKSTAAERRAARGAKDEAEHQWALDRWFALSGTTMTYLTAAITRCQPGPHPADAMSLHQEIIGQ
jgi:hypothetical protein